MTTPDARKHLAELEATPRGDANAPWNPFVGPHTRAAGPGADYCVECSKAIYQWVAWPCRDFPVNTRIAYSKYDEWIARAKLAEAALDRVRAAGERAARDHELRRPLRRPGAQGRLVTISTPSLTYHIRDADPKHIRTSDPWVLDAVSKVEVFARGGALVAYAEGPMLRRDGTRGKHTRTVSIDLDASTGWVQELAADARRRLGVGS